MILYHDMYLGQGARADVRDREGAERQERRSAAAEEPRCKAQ